MKDIKVNQTHSSKLMQLMPLGRQQVHQDGYFGSLQRRNLYRQYPHHQTRPSRPPRPLSFPAARAFPGRDFPGRDFPGVDFPGGDIPGSDTVVNTHARPMTTNTAAAMPALTYDFHMRQLEEFIEEYKGLQKEVTVGIGLGMHAKHNACTGWPIWSRNTVCCHQIQSSVTVTYTT